MRPPQTTLSPPHPTANHPPTHPRPPKPRFMVVPPKNQNHTPPPQTTFSRRSLTSEATGPGSKDAKLKLLKLFLTEGIKSPSFADAFVTFGLNKGNKTEATWKPYKYMVDYYGLAEFMRRLQNGTILSQKDGNEWEFRLVTKTEYEDKHTNMGLSAKNGHKISDKAMLEDVMNEDKDVADFFRAEDQSKQDPDLIHFLEQKGALKKAGPDHGPDHGGEQELAEIGDKLSALTANSAKKPKELLKNALALLQGLLKKPDKSDNARVIIQHHISQLQEISRAKGTKVEDVKNGLLKAMQAIKSV